MELKNKEKIIITIDNKVDEVLKLEEEGKEMFFASGDKFLQLDKKTIENLSSNNKMRYLAARTDTEALKEEKPSGKVQFSPRFAMATQRLEVEPLLPNIAFCWKRPEELQYAKTIGYALAIEGRHCRTFAANDGENPMIGKAGEEELRLMYTSIENHDAIIKAVGDKSRRKDEAVMEQARDTVDKLGGKSFDIDNAPDGAGKWS